jgi:hypothetical protein
MDNVQNFDSYNNIPLSQTYRISLFSIFVITFIDIPLGPFYNEQLRTVEYTTCSLLKLLKIYEPLLSLKEHKTHVFLEKHLQLQPFKIINTVYTCGI